MTKNLLKNSLESQDQLVISYELLCLLHWLIEHDTTKIQRMIHAALKKGLYRQITHKEHKSNIQSLDQAQQTMSEFFIILEALFLDTLTTYEDAQTTQKDTLPELDRIDTKDYDSSTVQLSIEQATKNAHKSENTLQELLFQELLRRWKPNKNSIIN